jgi:dolichyl-phosphate-mannose-protein mannosyltransferase
MRTSLLIGQRLVLHVNGMIISLATSIIAFGLISLSSLGIGDLVLSGLNIKETGRSSLLGLIIKIAIGLGLIGQTIFFLGLLGDTYQKKYFWAGFVVISIASAFKFRTLLPNIDVKVIFKKLTLIERLVLSLLFFYFACWLWVSLGFWGYGNALSRHYLHVKILIQQKQFCYENWLPFGMPDLAFLGPSLMQMLYLPAKLLGDDRAANLIHWLVNVVLSGALYCITRHLFNRSAGLFVVAIYLGCSFLNYYPLDIEDYTFQAFFMLLSLHCLFLYRNSGSLRHLILAAVLAGLMLSVKYYGIPLMLTLCTACFILGQGVFRAKMVKTFFFGAMACLTFSPWAIYNVVKFSNPLYPFMCDLDWLGRLSLIRPVSMLSPFLTPQDVELFWPKVLYYLSIFIPFDQAYHGFGLSPVFLMALPCSVLYLMRCKADDRFDAKLLFILAVVTFLSLDFSAGSVSFYKWSFYAGLIFAVSIAGMWLGWPPAIRKWGWAIVGIVMVVNLWQFKDAFERYGRSSPKFEQEERWSPLARYLNKIVGEGEAIAGARPNDAYYVRSDINMLYNVLFFLSKDWDFEESYIHNSRVKYYVFYKNAESEYTDYYERNILLLRKLGFAERADAACESLRWYLERVGREENFLEQKCKLIKKLPRGIEVYELTKKAS